MSKTYKKREKRGNKEKRESSRKRKSRKNKSNIHFQSTGFVKTFTMNHDSKKDEKDLVWNSDYNGDKGNMNIFFNKNGKKEKINIQMNKDEIEKLLIEPSIDSRLDKRLLQDFHHIL